MNFLLTLFLSFLILSNLSSEAVSQDQIHKIDINYIASKSATVILAWRLEDYALEDIMVQNVPSKLSEGLLYTPMELREDTFKITLNLPYGSTLNYSFWITKNKQGQYEDFWDIESGNRKVITDSLTITKHAVYGRKVEQKESKLVKYAWLLLLVVLIPYLTLKWRTRKIAFLTTYNSYELRILMVGISLFFLNALARADIIDVHPLSIRNDFSAWGKVMKASWNDLIYVSGLTAFFLLVIWRLKNELWRKWIYTIFIVAVFLSTLICLTNITTIVFLGTPLTYQWLYYADFLGSREATEAIGENLSLTMILNIAALTTSVFIIASLLGRFISTLSQYPRLQKSSFTIMGVLLFLLMTQAFFVKTTWTEGQENNPVTAFAYSMWLSDSKPLIYSAEPAKGSDNFDPGAARYIETPIYDDKDERVKNVILIVLESAGASYFDAYGGTYQLSPNLNKYSTSAIRFDQMYAHAPATNRSLVAILGSMYPDISYKSITQEYPDIAHPTIISELGKHGYRTSFFSSADLSFQSSDKYLSHRGLDHLEDYSQIHCSEKFEINNPEYQKGDGIDDMCLADRLATWVEEDTTQNFFSMIWTVQGHYPYYFAGKEQDFSEPNHSFNRYLNVLEHNDRLVGKVIQLLEDRQLDSTTLVVVTGDHGEAFGQHNQFGHGTSIYEENIRVPLYFINPTLFNGEEKNDIATMKDLATTIFSILNVQIPDTWQGRDLMQTDLNEAFYFAPWSAHLFGYRKDNMKFIFNETAGSAEVYDLDSDRTEQHNLIAETSEEELEHARSRLGAWMRYQDKYVEMLLKNSTTSKHNSNHNDS